MRPTPVKRPSVRTNFPNSVRRQRPSWWTPEKVLACLRGGENPTELCIRAAGEMVGTGSAGAIWSELTPRAFQRDITLWKQSATWGAAFTAATAQYRGGKFKISKDWYEDFYEAMAVDSVGGRIELAAEIANVKPEIVYALMDKRNSVFDPDFTERVRILEGRRMSKIREATLDGALNDPKVGQKILEAAMPHLHLPAQKLEVSGTIKKEVTHLLDASVIEAVRAQQHALMGSGERSRQSQQQIAEQSESAGDVIDAEAVLVKERR